MLSDYKDRLVPFSVELCNLSLGPRERAIFEQFQNGKRTGLGLSAWSDAGLSRVLQLTGAVIAWKTLCFPNQLTTVFAPSIDKGSVWINGFAHFISQCNQRVRSELRFSFSEPRVTVAGDDFWRVLAIRPVEGEVERTEPHLTNAIFYDFEHVPAWIIKAASEATRNKPMSVTFSISLLDPPPERHPVEPADSEWKPDEADDE